MAAAEFETLVFTSDPEISSMVSGVASAYLFNCVFGGLSSVAESETSPVCVQGGSGVSSSAF